MAQRHEMENFLEDKAKKAATPQTEIFKAVYRRRGSDLIFAATDQQMVQVTRFNHRFKAGEAYLHPPDDIESRAAAIKEMLEAGGYKLMERTNL